jgi:hypothetical protein
MNNALSIFAGLVIAITGGYFAGQHTAERVELPQTAAVVDFDNLLKAINPYAPDKKSLDARAEATRARVTALADNGVIVFDPASIVAAPAKSYVK